jgi:hypothetical protein
LALALTPGVTMQTTEVRSDVAAQQASVHRLPLPTFRKPYTHLRRQMLAFRVAFEQVLLREHGSVNEWQAKLLRTAAKAYGAALRCDHVLARSGKPGDALKHEQYLAYLDRSVRFEQETDRALRALGLDRREAEDAIDATYRELAAQQARRPNAATDNAQPADAGDRKAAGQAQAAMEDGADHLGNGLRATNLDGVFAEGGTA